MRKYVLMVVAIVLIAAAVVAYAHTKRSDGAATTTTTSTTTTTAPPYPTAPLTGLPDPTGVSLTRPHSRSRLRTLPKLCPSGGSARPMLSTRRS